MPDFWIAESVKDRSFDDYYELGKELGSGATSKVYKCNAKGSDQAWAVKVINKKVDRKVVKTEVGILLKISHVNVIRMKEIFETPTQILLVLELVTGGELFERIVNRGKYSEKDAALAVREMLEGLEYLHKNDIMHRDLKPENLLYENLSEKAKLKIADFGLSKIIGAQVTTNTVCGTPGYCAPEVVKGKCYDTKVDMWSIGVIAYILLCGYEPFYDDEETIMYKKILKGNYEFDSPWWDNITENAKDFIRKLLIVDVKSRLSAVDALKHPWVIGSAADDKHLEETQKKIKEFNAKRKLKALTDITLVLGPHFGVFGDQLQGQISTSDVTMQVSQEAMEQ
ncbi:calcium/calmodulin-dependent protein kinase type IV-like isoform X2 [Mya arenaria]|uniref:calcium/calmodulin-dependent protein kinase type IV-like isoform X2 n=1 Tax=Mya arenaria TaxID=6604 RepID=UPI0022E304A2|nr:calcium/calmodulin-dependent protein kinase type IV-like isoform X2 [Mya arenaria]